MSYSDDAIRSLTFALRDTEGLKNTIKSLNENIAVLERLAIAIEEQNRLKRIELNLEEQKEESYFRRTLSQKKY